MNWRFFINTTVIEEPIGWSELTINIIRDEIWQGVFFHASGSSLQFYGEAFDLLKDLKISYGVDAEAIFRSEQKCEGGEWEEALRGKLNFAQYRERCGAQCFISMPWEQEDCTMILRNRYEQKVNIDSNIAFDGRTVLQNYDGLNFQMEIPAQEIQAGADAQVSGSDVVSIQQPFDNGFQADVLVRPTYITVRDNSINTAQLDNVVNNYQFTGDQQFNNISPQLLFEDIVGCFQPPFDYNIVLKGSFDLNTTIGGQVSTMSNKLILWDGVGDILTDGTEIDSENIPVSGPLPNFPETGTFDTTFTGTITIPEGSALYAFTFMHIATQFDPGETDFNITYDEETVFTLTAQKACPPTNASVSLVNETLSRITESITDMCIRVRSDYYGRTDSEPYTSTSDGCGSLRILTNGLKLRNAENDDFTISLKDAFDSLNAIDNIGMGVEGTTLRIEPIEYFYNNTAIFNMPAIPDMERSITEGKIYSTIKVGYKKWETESAKGLDEFNSNKEFRTTLKNVNNTLDITSDFIAAGYVIEQVRTQNFGNTGQADTKYDNDTFIICVVRSESYIQYAVEQGNITNGTGFFSPSTAYNWRIRPIYNLMRWGNSILNAYPNIGATDSKIVFTSGTGNYVASGELTAPDDCKQEAHVMAENSSVAATDYISFTPVLKPEDFNIEYPLSIAEYKLIKANPYGYINVQCGNGEYEKAYIQSIEYKIAQGMATFNLAEKWI